MQPAEGLPPAVLRFLELHVDSIEQLKVLLLLHDRAEREWRVIEVSRDVGSSDGSIERRLEDLTLRKMLKKRLADGRTYYRYAPEAAETAAVVAELKDTYRQRRLSVINAIYARPPSDIQSFSDAFELGKKKGGQG